MCPYCIYECCLGYNMNRRKSGVNNKIVLFALIAMREILYLLSTNVQWGLFYQIECVTCLCMNTTDPSNRHVPPCRSTCNIRNICRNRMPRMALVANTCKIILKYYEKSLYKKIFLNCSTCPLEPSVRTTIDATTTIRSAIKVKLKKSIVQFFEWPKF